MVKPREPQQVAKRALILSAIAFRSSLEVTARPGVTEISERILPWLTDIGCGKELDPIEREELATPIGQLSDSQMVDVRWAGEGAGFFCWMLGLGPELDATMRADPSTLPTFRSILKQGASEFIGSAILRSRIEIEAVCCHVVMILSMLRESRVAPPANDIIRRIHIQKLREVGVCVTEDATKRASEALCRMTQEDRERMAGVYVIRGHGAFWFLSDRASYFSPERGQVTRLS